MSIEQEIRALAPSTPKTWHRIVEHVQEIKDKSHYLVYQVLGITTKRENGLTSTKTKDVFCTNTRAHSWKTPPFYALQKDFLTQNMHKLKTHLGNVQNNLGLIACLAMTPLK